MERIDRLCLYVQGVSPLLAEVTQEILPLGGDVLAPRTQEQQDDADDVEAEEQVLAEITVLHE